MNEQENIIECYKFEDLFNEKHDYKNCEDCKNTVCDLCDKKINFDSDVNFCFCLRCSYSPDADLLCRECYISNLKMCEFI